MKPRLYEGMFVLDNREVKKDFDALRGRVTGLLEKHGAKILVARRWDERKLAYDIRGHKRATYLLTYFEAPGSALAQIHREVSLTEPILRTLFLTVDEVPPKAYEESPVEPGVGDEEEKKDEEGRVETGERKPAGDDLESEEGAPGVSGAGEDEARSRKEKTS